MFKKIGIYALSALVIAGIVYGVNAITLNIPDEYVSGNENLIGAQFAPVATFCNSARATTTLTYKTTTGASSTCVALIGDAESVDLKWITVGSSTSSQLNWQVSFANENEPTARTWYDEKNYTVTSNSLVTYGTGNVLRIIPTLTTSTQYHNTSIDNTNDKWMLVTYNFSGANGAVRLEIVPKNQTK